MLHLSAVFLQLLLRLCIFYVFIVSKDFLYFENPAYIFFAHSSTELSFHINFWKKNSHFPGMYPSWFLSFFSPLIFYFFIEI